MKNLNEYKVEKLTINETQSVTGGCVWCTAAGWLFGFFSHGHTDEAIGDMYGEDAILPA